MNTILFCCIGRRVRLISDFREAHQNVRILATDNNPFAPGLFVADKHFVVPNINDINYIDYIIELCKTEGVKVVTTLIDPEIELLARNRDRFAQNGILLLCPSVETAETCFDKYKMFEYLRENDVLTIPTFENFENFEKAHLQGDVSFPVFIKPRKGSGGLGATRVNSLDELKDKLKNAGFDYIIQKMMEGGDLDVDVYVDCISGEPVSMFSKRKLETRVGGAIKTVSFKDQNLVAFVKNITSKFHFNGPIDMDLFYVNGQYYLSEINPRFGGAYPHAFGAGVDFFQLILNNLNGIENQAQLENYEDDIMMMMYEDFIIEKKSILENTGHQLEKHPAEVELSEY